jgi:hypothetical protein
MKPQVQHSVLGAKVLTCRVPELGLVDERESGVRLLDNIELIVPGTMPEFDRFVVIGEGFEQLPQPVTRPIRAMKARWKLKQQASQFAGFN